MIAVSATRFSISEFDGRRFVKTRFNVPRHVPDTRYFAVLRDHLGAWWLGTLMGLYRFPPTGRIADMARVTPDAHYARVPGLPSDDLYPLFEDRRGDIWLTALLPDQARLVRWRRASDDFMPYGHPRDLAQSRQRGRSRVLRSSRARPVSCSLGSGMPACSRIVTTASSRSSIEVSQSP